ncbi:hypothetical protein F0562_033343 [Nyssa sinensis]|uniref:S-acyltransferase n=1 Tax=Nyssa sinensis TaxID=561372 RepID=A0A5J5AS99_9ASTE|nr:hypothetical protein F0562_033343 [Nyssa sinensis]
MEGGGSEGEKKKPPEGENKVKRKMKTALQLEILEKTYAVETYPSESFESRAVGEIGVFRSVQRNYRFFFMFVFSTTLLCIYVFGFCWVYIKRIVDSEHTSVWKAMTKTPASIVLIIYTFIAVWFVGGLSVFHLYLISTNQVVVTRQWRIGNNRNSMLSWLHTSPRSLSSFSSPSHQSTVPLTVVFEEGYTVTYSARRPQVGAFYTVSLPTSQESVIKRLAGNGTDKFSDGDSGSAMFNKPKSFAVDLKGNVYVADQKNFAIRKISNSGVTTIAGRCSLAYGHVDGPGQNATFSPDFELVFIPERCALMISDHGNQLVRQIKLKQEDCIRGSQSGLGVASAWILVLGVSCILSLIIGFAIRPYIIPHEGSNPLPFNGTWKHCLISLGRQVLMFYFDIRSAIVSSTSYTLLRRLILLSLSHLSLMFRVNLVETQTFCEKSLSLLDSDDLSSSNDITKSQMFADQLKDLISFDEVQELSGSSEEIYKQGDDSKERCDVLSENRQSIDKMILANVRGFTEQAEKTSQGEYLVSRSGLVKRR